MNLVRSPIPAPGRLLGRMVQVEGQWRALGQRTLEGVLAGAQCDLVRSMNRVENDLQSRTVESDGARSDGIGAVIRRNLRSRPTGGAFRNGDDHSLFAE